MSFRKVTTDKALALLHSRPFDPELAEAFLQDHGLLFDVDLKRNARRVFLALGSACRTEDPVQRAEAQESFRALVDEMFR